MNDESKVQRLSSGKNTLKSFLTLCAQAFCSIMRLLMCLMLNTTLSTFLNKAISELLIAMQNKCTFLLMFLHSIYIFYISRHLLITCKNVS